MSQQVVGEEKPLDLSQALKIAEKHGVTIRAEPIVTRAWSNRHYGRGIILYLPWYIVSVSIDRNGRETVEVDSSSDCFCSCPESSGSSDEHLW